MADQDPFAQFAVAPSAPTEAVPADDPFAQFAVAQEAPVDATEAPVDSAPAPVDSAPGNPPADESLLGKLDRYAGRVGEDIQSGIEGILSPFGNRVAVATAEALPGYIADAVTGQNKGVKFDRYYNQAKSDIEKRAGRSYSDNIGQAATDAALMLTGGGASHLSARVGQTVGTALASAPRVAQAGKFIASLATEAATQAGVLSAANQLDDMLDKGDYSGIAERLATVGHDALHAAEVGVVLGGGLQLLGKAAEKIAPKVQEMANERAFRAVQGRNTSLSRSIAKLGGKEKALELGEKALDEGIVRFGASADDIAAAATQKMEAAGAALGEARKELDSVAMLDAAANQTLTNATKSGSGNLGIDLIKSADGEMELAHGGFTANPFAPPPGYTAIGSIEAATPGVGQGTKLYAHAFDEAQARGNKLISDAYDQQSADAVAWWGKQVARGNARFDDGLGRFVLDRRPIPAPAVSPAGVNRQGLWNEVQTKVLDPLSQNPMSKQVARAVERRLRDVKQWASVSEPATFTETTAMRQFIDQELAGWEKLNPSATTDSMRQVRRVMEDYIMQSADDVAAALPEASPIVENIRRLKADFAQLKPIAKEATAGAERQLQNNAISLRGMMAGVGMAGNGPLEALGANIGVPGGALLGKAADAATTARAVSAVGRNWNANASTFLNKVAKSMASTETAATRMAPSLSTATRAAVNSKSVSPAPILKTAKALADQDSHESEALRQQAKAIEASLGPEASSAWEDFQRSKAAFLVEKAGMLPRSLPFGAPEDPMNPGESAAVARYVSAAEDPNAAIARVADGTHTAEDMDTLRTLYPGMLQQFRQSVVERMTSRKQALSWREQMQLSESLGMGTDPSALAFWSNVAQQSAAKKQAEKQQQAIARATPVGVKADLPNAASRGNQLG